MIKFLHPNTYDSGTWLHHRRTYHRGSTAEIYEVYTMVVHNYFAMAPKTEEMWGKMEYIYGGVVIFLP